MDSDGKGLARARGEGEGMESMNRASPALYMVTNLRMPFLTVLPKKVTTRYSFAQMVGDHKSKKLH